MRNPTVTKHALPLLITALLVPACSSAADSPDSAPSSTAATRNRTPSSAPKTSAPPPLTAANGSNVKACRKADCEILIHGAADIPLDPKFGCTRFTLTYSAPNQVSFDVSRPEYGDVHGYIQGTGYLGLSNGVTVTVKKIDASGAVLRFQPKTMDSKNDKFGGSEGLSFY